MDHSQLLSNLCRDVYSAAYATIVDEKVSFPDEFSALDWAVREVIADFRGVKTDVYLDFSEKTIIELNLSLIFSDFVSVFPLDNRKPLKTEITIMEDTQPSYPSKVSLPPDLVNKLLMVESSPIVKPCYMYPNDERVKDFLDRISEFALSGQIMVRPIPMLMCLSKDKFGDRQQWKMFGVDPNSPIETWSILDEESEQNTIPFAPDDFVSTNEPELCSFTLPYLEGLSFKDLFRILEDEKDYITEFRRGVREMIYEFEKESKFPKDLYNDVARPAVDKIERKFKAISKSRSMRIKGAVLGGAAISLGAYFTSGFLAALFGFLGASALNPIVKEWSEKTTGKADLREMPHYLLWRLKQAQKK